MKHVINMTAEEKAALKASLCEDLIKSQTSLEAARATHRLAIANAERDLRNAEARASIEFAAIQARIAEATGTAS